VVKFCTVQQFLAFAVLVDGRTSDELRRKLGVCDRTIRKYMQQARMLGMVIDIETTTHRHVVRNAGPFDLAKLAEAVLPKPSMGAMLMRGMR